MTADARDLHHLSALSNPPIEIFGHIVDIAPQSFRVAGLSPFVRLGDCVACEGPEGEELGEVVRVEEAAATIKPFDVAFRSGVRTRVRRTGPVTIAPALSWKGRAIDAFGRPCDGLGPLEAGEDPRVADRTAAAAMGRGRVRLPARTGVRAIDIFTPLAKGQRIGVFAGSGVGKSTLMGMLARAQGFDSVVVALVGERGREVREFLEETMKGALDRVVTVVATGDESPMMRRLAPKTAMCVAEHFRDLGDDVLLIVDSVTRLAHAARDVALAAGEPPVSRGYPPSVFSELPRLLERAGPGPEGAGTITGLFAVLVDGDDHNEPIADAIRGTLDGHVVLDRSIADAGRFPAIDLLKSISRLADLSWSPQERDLVGKLKAMIARYEDTSDLRLLGGYTRGTDGTLDQAVDLVPHLYAAMSQHPGEPSEEDAFGALSKALKAGLGVA